MLTQRYSDFATTYGVIPSVAYVLPALFVRSAQKINMSTEALLEEAMENRKVGEYLAGLAIEVAVADAVNV